MTFVVVVIDGFLSKVVMANTISILLYSTVREGVLGPMEIGVFSQKTSKDNKSNMDSATRDQHTDTHWPYINAH